MPCVPRASLAESLAGQPATWGSRKDIYPMSVCLSAKKAEPGVGGGDAPGEPPGAGSGWLPAQLSHPQASGEGPLGGHDGDAGATAPSTGHPGGPSIGNLTL